MTSNLKIIGMLNVPYKPDVYAPLLDWLFGKKARDQKYSLVSQPEYDEITNAFAG